jgi:hypothetical protein
MSERYYRYNSDDAIIDIENDEIYDWVLEREKLKELDNVGPSCMKKFGDEFNEEHFGNISQDDNNSMRYIFMIIFIIIILYLLYSFCQKDEFKLKNLPYKASFSY